MRLRTITLLALHVALVLSGCLPETAEQPTPSPSAATTAGERSPTPRSSAEPATRAPCSAEVEPSPCGSSPSTTPAETPIALGSIDRSTLVISYELRHMFEQFYPPSVTVSGDGRAVYSVYEGRSREEQLDAARLDRLIAAVERAEFFSLAGGYSGEGCGMHQPTITLSISANGRHKEVKYYTGSCDAPKRLKLLRLELEHILEIDRHRQELMPVQVKWFVGLGAGGDPEQVAREEALVEQINEANLGEIELRLVVIPYYEAHNVLVTQISAGTPPDIIGPMGNGPFDQFKQDLLPLDDLIAQHGLDLSAYDPRVLDSYRNEQGQLVALPYALYPSFIFYNKDLFDAAGLAYPPQRFGERYQDRPWDMAALRELAMQLTLDASGNNATEPGFNPATIVQYGFVPQWNDSASAEGAFFGTSDLIPEGHEVRVPELWKEAWRWFYRARHVEHFVPDMTALQKPGIESQNIWQAGKVAMAWGHLWLTCCFRAADVPRWDLAVVPSYNGTTTAKLHADTFAITRKPGRSERETNAIFKTYLALLDSPELRELYGGLPGSRSEQPAYLATLGQKYAPNTVRWQVALDSLAYADIPSHEQAVPHHQKFLDRMAAFDQLRHADPQLNLDAEIAAFERDLRNIAQGIDLQPPAVQSHPTKIIQE